MIDADRSITNGKTLFAAKKYKEAYKEFFDARSILSKQDTEETRKLYDRVNLCMFDCLEKLQQFDKGIKILEKLTDDFKTKGDDYHLVTLYQRLAVFLIKAGRKRDAYRYCDSAVDLSRKNKYDENIYKTAFVIADEHRRGGVISTGNLETWLERYSYYEAAKK